MLSAPAILAMAILFLAPAITFLSYSFLTGAVYAFSAEPPFTFDNVTKLIEDGTTRTLAQNSLIVGALAAVVCVVVAVPVAYWLRYHAGRWQRPLLVLVVLTFFTSYLVRIYAWRTILGEKGVLNDVLTRVGIVDEPLNIFLYNRFAVVLAIVHILLPIVVLIIFAGLRPLDPRYIECASDLGAGAIDRWRRVILPVLAVPIASAGMLAFVIASADYVTPQLLGGPGQAMLGVEIQNQLKALGDYPAGAALSLMVVVAYGVLYGLIAIATRVAGLHRIEWQS